MRFLPRFLSLIPYFLRGTRFIFYTSARFVRGSLLILLRAYKLILSPYLGNRCRFYPSCADYAQSAIVQHGVTRGSFLMLKRICRCHPFCQGGVDLVPPKRPVSPKRPSSASFYQRYK